MSESKSSDNSDLNTSEVNTDSTAGIVSGLLEGEDGDEEEEDDEDDDDVRDLLLTEGRSTIDAVDTILGDSI